MKKYITRKKQVATKLNPYIIQFQKISMSKKQRMKTKNLILSNNCLNDKLKKSDITPRKKGDKEQGIEREQLQSTIDHFQNEKNKYY